MSDTQHTRELVLTARIENKSPSHAVIGVFQNGGKAGELCVDVEFAEQIVGLIAAAPDLLAACKGAICSIDAILNNVRTAEKLTRSQAIYKLSILRGILQARHPNLKAALAKAVQSCDIRPETLRTPANEKEPKMSDTQHAPTPWVIKAPGISVGHEKEGDRLVFAEETKEHVAEVFQYRNNDHKDEATSLANAEFIVRACNSHADLLAACEQMAGWITSKGSRPPCIKRARAAIAKTKEQQ